MNKYKIICLVLAVSLLGALARLVFVSHPKEQADVKSSSEIVLQNIMERKSVRHFKDTPVSREQLDTLLTAAMAAPTAWDLRPWKFVVVDEHQIIDSLAYEMSQFKKMINVQALIVICGDLSLRDKQGNAPELWALDCSAATENMLLQAEAMGLGAVWISVYPVPERANIVKKILNLPDHIHPLNIIPVGYPEGLHTPKDKYNKDNIHYNAW